MQQQTDFDPTELALTDNDKFTIAAANGTVLYVLAYTVVYAIHQTVKIMLSSHYHLRGVWDASRIVYTMADNEWWKLAIIAVNGIGPFAAMLLWVAAYRWYWTVLRAKRGLFKLLILWVSLHACNLVFGALLADTFTQSGFWFVPSWVFQLGNVPNVVLAIFAGIAELAIGYFMSTAFLQAHDSKTVMRYQNRQRMVLYTLLLPYVFGTFLIALSRLPTPSLSEILRLSMMGLLVGPLCLGSLNELFGSTVRGPQNTRMAWGLAGFMIILLLLWRLFLTPPIHFEF